MFSSRRERRLWAWTTSVVIAIFATLEVAQSVAAYFDGGFVGVWLFGASCLLVLAAVVTRGLTRRPSGAELAVALGVSAVYLLIFVRMAIPTERSHLIEYGVLALLMHEALLERASNARWVPFPGVLAISGSSAIGVVDELVQRLLPSRVFDVQDIVFNILAAALAVVSSLALAAARRWADQRRSRSEEKP